MNEETIIILADDTHQFFETELGRYLMGKIDATIEEGLDKLKEVNPYKPEEIQMAQFDVWKAAQLKIWFNEIMVEGEMVLQRRLLEDD